MYGIGIACLRHIASGVPCLIDKEMVRVSISDMKNGKAAGLLGVVPEMVKAAREAGVDMITDLVNQVIVEDIPKFQNGNLALL